MFTTSKERKTCKYGLIGGVHDAEVAEEEEIVEQDG